MNKPKYERHALHRSVAALRKLQQARPLTLADLRAEAARSGYSERHLRRSLEDSNDAQDSAARVDADFRVDPEVITAVFLACGNMAQAYRLLEELNATAKPAERMPLPSQRTFRRKVREEMGTDIEYARLGSAG